MTSQFYIISSILVNGSKKNITFSVILVEVKKKSVIPCIIPKKQYLLKRIQK